MKRSGVLIGNFCPDPKEVSKARDSSFFRPQIDTKNGSIRNGKNRFCNKGFILSRKAPKRYRVNIEMLLPDD